MGVVCKKCGTENSFTSLFCVSCGEKLELDNMDVKTMSKTPFSWKKFLAKLGKILYRVIGYGILVAIIAICVPAGGNKARIGTPDAALEKKISDLCKGKAPNKTKEVTLTDSEVSGIIKAKFASTLTSKSYVALRVVGVHFMEGNKVQTTLRFKLFDMIPWDVRVNYLMEVKEYPAEEKDKPAVKQLDFTLGRVYLGRLPLPMFVSRLLAEKSEQMLVESQELTNLRMHVAAVKTEYLPLEAKPAEKTDAAKDGKPKQEEKPAGKQSLKAKAAADKAAAKPAPTPAAKPAPKPAPTPAAKPAPKPTPKTAAKSNKQSTASKAVNPVKKAMANKAAKETMVETGTMPPQNTPEPAVEAKEEKPVEAPAEVKVETPEYPEGKVIFTVQ